jgi:hypothetical protein
MPRGYWGIILAAFGFLILGNTEQDRRPNHHSRVKQAPAQPAAVPKSPHAPPAAEFETKCQGTSQPWLTCDSIAAQAAIDQARDADKQAAAVWWQFGVGALTLAAAVAASIFAWLAAHHTKRGANVASEALTLSADTAKRQLRAYIGVEPEGVNDGDGAGVMRLPLTIHNSGQTPAHHVIIFSKLNLVEHPREFDPRRDGGKYISGEANDVTIGPGVKHVAYLYADAGLVNDNAVAIRDKKLALIHFGPISYQDIFGESRETRFAFYHWGAELSDAASRRCRFGNSST